MFPQILVDIRNFLINKHLDLSKQSRDGRINSAFNEDEILETILRGFPNVQRPSVRDWVDFSITIDDCFVPVNIKVTNTTTADNLNCKLGIYYALTGSMPYFSNTVDWDTYFRALHENLCTNHDKDYYFLIVNKRDSGDIFLASLKTLAKISPNGNNLPFQAKWHDNRHPKNRTYSEAKDFILSCFSESLKLRANAYSSFCQYFREYQ